MSAAHDALAAAAALVDELGRTGVRHACLTPGSRSTPLALALCARPRLTLWTHVDERSAAFFALGLAKATRTPVALACTSGTAAANFLPAVVEAFHARVPLVVLTADRPPELRDCGAAQTIDQVRLFGTHVRWFFDVGPPDGTPAALRWTRALACRAVGAAVGPPAGPVHLNLSFREPLLPEVPSAWAAETPSPERDGPWTRLSPAAPRPDPAAVAEAAAVLAEARRPVLVCGPLDDPDPQLPGAVSELAHALGAPVLDEPAANLRAPVLRPHHVEAADAVLRHARLAEALAPDAIVRLGSLPTSKVLATFLARHASAPQIVLEGRGAWSDPLHVASHVVLGAASASCAEIAARLAGRRPETTWRERWQAAGARARGALQAALAAHPPFEGHAVAALAATLPAAATLYVGNSLPVRALDWFWPETARPLRILVNRGANGIDGFVSSVLGAAAGSDAPTVGLCGDLTLYHDLNGLLAVRRHRVRAVLVVLNNDGGGIFDHLPVAQVGEPYEPLFVIPHGLDFGPGVEMYGAAFRRVGGPEALRAAVADALHADGTTVVELPVDRARSLAAHRDAWARAATALDTLP